jgi:uncharacterized hydrophobic protein (TIGR00271 family)
MTKQTLFLRKLLDLREGSQSKAEIVENVKDDTEFSSARVWALVSAIVLASVGLNMNSIPVIIGAMLISPLMGPIVSIGLALATEDWGLMRRSAKNLLTQTVISIVISSIYFSLTPITNAQSELLARIQPTLFDVLIAIFGGLAGFIGISRARQNNIVPGVAIATALMPPLCTVGYGIGTWQPKFIIGAFYLFLINSIFICLASLVVARYMQLPRKEYMDVVKKKRVHRIIMVVIIAIVVPAVYQAVVVVKHNNFILNADKYVRTVFEENGYVVIYKNIEYNQKEKSIELAFLSQRVSDDDQEKFKNQLADFGLAGTDLIIRQNKFALTEDEWRRLVETAEDDKEHMKLLEEQLANRSASLVAPEQLKQELQALEGRVSDVAVGSVSRNRDGKDEQFLTVLVYVSKNEDDEQELERDRLTSWLKQRLNADTAEVLFIEKNQEAPLEQTEE